MTRLQERWRAVLTEFFPEWEAASEWRCEPSDRYRTGDGRCDTDNKVVMIGIPLPAADDGLDAILVHEVAHEVSAMDHGTGWQGRMETAPSRPGGVGGRNRPA